MEFRLLSAEEGTKIKERFDAEFLLSPSEFISSYREFYARLIQNGDDFQAWYDDAYRWDKLRPEAHILSYDAALQALRKQAGKVLIMSENDGNRSSNMCKLEGYEKNQKGFVAEVSAVSLAERIEYEWYMEYAEETPLGREHILPEDLYVFTPDLSWVLVFTHELVTHETDKNEVNLRYCLSYGI